MEMIAMETPSEFLCPITHGLMREPVRARDGHTYEKLAIERWFAQRATSPLTGSSLESTSVEALPELQMAIRTFAESRRDTDDGQLYFACPFCNADCANRAACKAKYEKQLRSDAAFGAAARRRRWIEGTLLPSAERVLRTGPVSAGALMVGAFSVGAVGAIVGGVASSVAEVVSGGIELAHGLADSLTGASDDEDRPSWARGCFKIASGAVLVPVASASIAAMFALGAAAGSVALATGILKELANAAIHTVRLTSNAIMPPPTTDEA
ncbi:hypothetical protein CTAYLR_009652 [Chrysophaeum taylorii]|uniref:U-box domain-containing protein n=1 Tax=Chrysophaeum taylorii TaxID=2483200 RepID=A0AAD7XK34_9STRA|nr:hypothetical protein CTAYLR_009652 [Chrysophaeum taylorii]